MIYSAFPKNRRLSRMLALGAGEGDFVLITQGSSARLTPETSKLPIDAIIIGIVDQIHVEQHEVLKR